MSARSKARIGFRWLLGALLVLQGINHFIADDVMVRMIPDVLPYPRLLVYLSGVAEILLGVLVFPPRTRRLAGWGIIALLVAVFPANVKMALDAEQWPVSEALLWGRLPLQLVFFYWAWATCLARKPGADAQSSTP